MEEEDEEKEEEGDEEGEDPPSITEKCLIQQNEVTLARKTKTARLGAASHCFFLFLLLLQAHQSIRRTGYLTGNKVVLQLFSPSGHST